MPSIQGALLRRSRRCRLVLRGATWKQIAAERRVQVSVGRRQQRALLLQLGNVWQELLGSCQTRFWLSVAALMSLWHLEGGETLPATERGQHVPTASETGGAKQVLVNLSTAAEAATG
jgi:hypothetical protein